MPASTYLRLALLTTGLTGSLVVGLTAQPAGAGPPAPSPAVTAQPVAADPDAALVASLGDRTVGSYVRDGRTVVTVTDEAAAGAVRAAGAVPQLVTRSGRVLADATATLQREAGLPGTAWSVDPATDQVVAQVDDSVTGARLATVRAAAATLGSSVRLERVPGRLAPLVAGGDAIFGGSFRCSLGFNVRSGATFSFLTAGHCGNISATWFANSAHTKLLGNRTGSSFPGNDYAIVRYSGGAKPPGSVDLYNGSRQNITTAGNAHVGQAVKRSGSTTGLHSGTVQATNATVNYAEGTVTGLIRTNVCAEPGDSGGALFAGPVALGLTSGGSGNCSAGGTTFFQPVTEPLSVFGVSVY